MQKNACISNQWVKQNWRNIAIRVDQKDIQPRLFDETKTVWVNISKTHPGKAQYRLYYSNKSPEQTSRRENPSLSRALRCWSIPPDIWVTTRGDPCTLRVPAQLQLGQPASAYSISCLPQVILLPLFCRHCSPHLPCKFTKHIYFECEKYMLLFISHDKVIVNQCTKYNKGLKIRISRVRVNSK